MAIDVFPRVSPRVLGVDNSYQSKDSKIALCWLLGESASAGVYLAWRYATFFNMKSCSEFLNRVRRTGINKTIDGLVELCKMVFIIEMFETFEMFEMFETCIFLVWLVFMVGVGCFDTTTFSDIHIHVVVSRLGSAAGAAASCPVLQRLGSFSVRTAPYSATSSTFKPPTVSELLAPPIRYCFCQCLLNCSP